MDGWFYGYVYKTILPDGRFYIGQKKSDAIIPTYFGSGVIINCWFRNHLCFKATKCPEDIAITHGVTRQILAYATSQDNLNSIEQSYIDDNLSDPKCINLIWMGVQPDPKKIGDALRGRQKSREHSDKIREAAKHRPPVTQETRQKMSDALQGKTPWNKGLTKEVDPRVGSQGGEWTEERRKLHSRLRSGSSHTDETRARISKTLTGITRSDETRARMSKPKSDETRKKISLARLGNKASDETRIKQSQAKVGRHWFNDGVVQVMEYVCPDGYIPGQLKK